MTHKALIKLLTVSDIPFVIVGGVALRLYNSPRVTHDIDLAVRILDVDRILGLLYPHGYRLITSVSETSIHIALDADTASRFIEDNREGSASLVLPYITPSSEYLTLEEIDISSQIDLLFELGIPIPVLLKNANQVKLDDTQIFIASIQDLITLKDNRTDKSITDEDDIRFLRRFLDSE